MAYEADRLAADARRRGTGACGRTGSITAGAQATTQQDRAPSGAASGAGCSFESQWLAASTGAAVSLACMSCPPAMACAVCRLDMPESTKDSAASNTSARRKAANRGREMAAALMLVNLRPGRGRNKAGRGHSFATRSRRALAITETELSAIAAAAMAGESSRPSAGYSTPAASGTPAVL